MKKSELRKLVREVLLKEADEPLTKDEIKALRSGVAKVMKRLERDVKDAQESMKEDPEGYIDADYIKMLKDDMKRTGKLAHITSVKQLSKAIDDMDTSPREDIESALPRSLVSKIYGED